MDRGKTEQKTRTEHTRGFSLIEAIVSIFIASMTIVFLFALLNIRTANRNSAYRSKAAELADEEVNALRRLDFASLNNQSSAPFRNVVFNAGTWQISTDASGGSSHSAPKVLETPVQTGFSASQVSARLLLPAGSYGDSTLQAVWNVQPDSSNGWSVGFLLRATDKDNSYQLRIAQNDGFSQTDLDPGTVGIQNVMLDVLNNGTATKLLSVNATISKGNWLKLTLAATGSSLSVSLNGTPLGTLTDTTWSAGPSALVVFSGAHVHVDDVKTVPEANCSASTCWDFEGLSALDAAWIRLGINDLPDATPTTYDDNGVITVESYPDVSSTTLKKVTVTVTWNDRGTARSYAATTLIGRNGFGS